jgi:hypothetical protein
MPKAQGPNVNDGLDISQNKAVNPNPHTVPLIPNRRGTCAGLSPSPHPIHQATYFSLVGPMSLGSVSRPHVAGGDGPGRGWGAGRGGGGGVRGVSASYIQ